jgi:hypothetical protein
MMNLWAGSLGNKTGPIKRGGGNPEPAARDKLLAMGGNWPLLRPFAGCFGRAGRR